MKPAPTSYTILGSENDSCEFSVGVFMLLIDT